MMKFNREEGLTLIELLITIAVIAIVAAISVPVITNVINDSADNSAAAMQEQVQQFVSEGADAGTVTYAAATQTFELRIDANGSQADGDEYLLKSLVVDSRFAVTDTAGTGTSEVPSNYTVAANN